MKLRNKKTGEIIDTFPHKHSLFEEFNSLAELNAEWEDTFEERHGWAPDCDYEVRKTNVDDISYKYANPDVTKAFDILDGKEVDNVK